MRVKCNTVDEFLENLSAEETDRVVQRVVRVGVTSNPVDGDQRDAVKFRVNVQASAVVDLPDDEGQYLLEVGEHCGFDYNDASQDRAGSERAAELKGRIGRVCRALRLEVRPGIIDF